MPWGTRRTSRSRAMPAAWLLPLTRPLSQEGAADPGDTPGLPQFPVLSRPEGRGLRPASWSEFEPHAAPTFPVVSDDQPLVWRRGILQVHADHHGATADLAVHQAFQVPLHLLVAERPVEKHDVKLAVRREVERVALRGVQTAFPRGVHIFPHPLEPGDVQPEQLPGQQHLRAGAAADLQESFPGRFGDRLDQQHQELRHVRRHPRGELTTDADLLLPRPVYLAYLGEQLPDFHAQHPACRFTLRPASPTLGIASPSPTPTPAPPPTPASPTLGIASPAPPPTPSPSPTSSPTPTPALTLQSWGVTPPRVSIIRPPKLK